MFNSPKNCDIGRHHYVWFMRYQVVNTGLLACIFFILCIMPAKEVIYSPKILCVLLEEDQRSESICSWTAGIHFGLCQSGSLSVCSCAMWQECSVPLE